MARKFTPASVIVHDGAGVKDTEHLLVAIKTYDDGQTFITISSHDEYDGYYGTVEIRPEDWETLRQAIDSLLDWSGLDVTDA